MKNDIYIEPNGLNSTIEKIKEDNNEIYQLMDNINNLFIGIDNNKWDTPSRKSMDEELIPFITERKETIKNVFENNVTFLNNVVSIYLSKNELIENSSEKLES